MRGVLVFHSRWGNCRQVAEAIAAGLGDGGHQVELVQARAGAIAGEPAFIVVGSPTRAGHMSGPVKQFIEREVTEAWKDKPFAAFGTGHLKRIQAGDPQSADDIYDALISKGLVPLVSAHKAVVLKMRGPLAEGELEDARRFGVDAGAALDRVSTG